jgi:hypothetical protein
MFENSETHQLVSGTPAGQYHIDMLDLNHETFVWERRKRAQYIHLMNSSPALLAGTFEQLRDLMTFVREQIELLIPPISAPPETTASKMSGGPVL